MNGNRAQEGNMVSNIIDEEQALGIQESDGARKRAANLDRSIAAGLTRLLQQLPEGQDHGDVWEIALNALKDADERIWKLSEKIEDGEI